MRHGVSEILKPGIGADQFGGLTPVPLSHGVPFMDRMAIYDDGFYARFIEAVEHCIFNPAPHPILPEQAHPDAYAVGAARRVENRAESAAIRDRAHHLYERTAGARAAGV